jgi:hypothetical protein
MRAMTAQTAIVLATVLALVGCRSGGSGWSWNRKNSDAPLAKSADPALPSAGAAPTTDYASSAYSSATAPQVEAGSAFAAPPAASYEGAPYPGATAAAMTPYGAPPATTPVADPAATAAMPQQGAYSNAYGTPPAAAPAAYPATGATAYPAPQTAQASPTANPYAGADAYGAAANYGTPPADQYGSAAAPPANPYDTGAAPVADPAPYPSTSETYPGAQPEQVAANQYGAQQPGADPYGVPDAPPAAAGYQPGSTSYDPGNTGYSPPGVPPYEMPAQPNVVASRKAPYFRPGGTSDYVPPTQSPTAVADRYSNPAAAYSQPSPYAPSDGSQSPAQGYTQ